MGSSTHDLSEAASSMDISEQSRTFQGFLSATAWVAVYTAISVAALTTAFALGFGWFAGLAAGLAVGVGAGLFLRMSAAYWISLVVVAGLCALGGGIVALAV